MFWKSTTTSKTTSTNGQQQQQTLNNNKNNNNKNINYLNKLETKENKTTTTTNSACFGKQAETNLINKNSACFGKYKNNNNKEINKLEHKSLNNNNNNNNYDFIDDSKLCYCGYCNMELNGSFVLAKGRAWCPEHFCCANSACAKPLMESGFVEDPESRRNYCPKCYEVLLAPICFKCSLPLNEYITQ
uniref:LIM zinc-binding domain-containing protein n=1 Tax=Meloidogyne enterolobii TaxID=390850 RepID=A0A6V7UBB4_MELEN|nr:unnamed protein product [Meloidogyne enterolobii]